jgi:hypothetical protein
MDLLDGGTEDAGWGEHDGATLVGLFEGVKDYFRNHRHRKERPSFNEIVYFVKVLDCDFAKLQTGTVSMLARHPNLLPKLRLFFLSPQPMFWGLKRLAGVVGFRRARSQARRTPRNLVCYGECRENLPPAFS